MRVGFNARTLSTDQVRGWSRYTSSLIRELSHLGVDIVLFSDRSMNESLLAGADFSRIQTVLESGSSYMVWEQKVLANMANQARVEILHCPINYGLPLLGSFKKVLTLHDAIEVAFYGQDLTMKDKLSVSYWRMKSLYKIAQVAADHVITVSEHAKKDIVKWYGVNADKISVTYEAAPNDFLPTNAALSTGDPYFFYVGGFEKRKNVNLLIEAMASLKGQKVQLKLAGDGDGVELLKKRTIELGLESQIEFLDWVDDSQLPALYAGARAFVYPSFYEGFGLQVVEAIACGVPVVCSNNTCLTEVLGFDDTGFSPHSAEELAKQMSQILNDQSFYEAMKRKSMARSKQFSWRKTAEQTLMTYEQLLRA